MAAPTEDPPARRPGPEPQRTPASPSPAKKGGAVWIYLVPLLLFLALQFAVWGRGSADKLSYSEFRQAVAGGRVTEVLVGATTVEGRYRKGDDPKAQPVAFETTRVDDEELLRELLKQNVKVVGTASSSLWANVISWLLPLLLLGGWLFVLRRSQAAGGGGSLFSMGAVGRNKARLYEEKATRIGFDDVAGVDEAKEELREVIEFLQHPEKFGRLGGKMPKGILLVGPPGTGKTLLARAVAGEAGVPFFSISGSEFVEMFVGVGAARVRDLFEQARDKAPCIIFIDELDALGKARGVGPMSHDEREQTLNQLLVELDGFDPRSGVVLMAATNRPEILDPALLRPGRFDRHVLVDRPDKIGRLAILKVHARRVPLEREADLDAIAAMTPGFAGADLANLVNEAALLAVRRGEDRVRLADLQEAVERIIGGLEKRNRVLNRMERERVAHHEIGHALTALALPGSDEVRKISIVPRGIAALGYTLQLPTEDRFLMTQAELENKIAVLLGGRVAEELVFGDVSTGAHDDLSKATQLAVSMVRSYGMSPRIGLVRLERDREPLAEGPFGALRGEAVASEQTLRTVDAEVRRIIEEQHQRVTALLGDRREPLRRAAAELLARETLDGTELRALAGEAGAPSASVPPTEAPRVAAR